MSDARLWSANSDPSGASDQAIQMAKLPNGVYTPAELRRRMATSRGGRDGEQEDGSDDLFASHFGKSKQRTELDDDGDENEQEEREASQPPSDRTTPRRTAPTRSLARRLLRPSPQVQCNITFVSVPPRLHIDRSVWTATAISRPAMTLVATLYDDLHDLVIANLERDGVLLERLHKRKRILVYDLNVPMKICDEVSVDSANSKHRFASMGDFLADQSQHNAFDAMITLTVETRQPAHENQPPHRYQTVRENDLGTRDLVFERTHHHTDSDRREYTYVRLGTVPPDQPRRPPPEHRMSSNNDITENQSYNEWLRSRGVPSQDVLLGWYFVDHPTRLHMIRVPAWKIGGLWIGNCVDDWQEHEFDDQDDYEERFRAAQSNAELNQLVRAYIDEIEGGDNEDSGVPFDPLYTLNNFDPRQYGLGAEVKKTDIVVSFISHIDLQHTGKDPIRALPWNVQFDIDYADGAGQVKARLRAELRRWASDQSTPLEARRAITPLFQQPLFRRWKIELWVLPHWTKKLFRFPTGHAEEIDGLEQFLDQDLVSKAKGYEAALYVEAHIVQVGEEENDVVLEPIVNEVPNEEEENEYEKGGEGGSRSGTELSVGSGDEDEDGDVETVLARNGSGKRRGPSKPKKGAAGLGRMRGGEEDGQGGNGASKTKKKGTAQNPQRKRR